MWAFPATMRASAGPRPVVARAWTARTESDLPHAWHYADLQAIGRLRPGLRSRRTPCRSAPRPAHVCGGRQPHHPGLAPVRPAGRIIHHRMAATIAAAIYLNFFTHHFIGDFRWYLAACTWAVRALDRHLPAVRSRSPDAAAAGVHPDRLLHLAGQNAATFLGVWRYPHQIGAWTAVHVAKWSSWSLLVIMTFTIVASLKHIRKVIHVPE